MPKQFGVVKEKAVRVAGRLLAPVILFEWGGILTYFYCSNRLAAFLHPSFRPPVLLTGLLLLGTAVCVIASGSEDELNSSADCADECEHSHGKLTLGGLLAFAVLLLPIALAAKISPDSYGAVLIHNRGLAESSDSVPGGIPESLPATDPIRAPATAASFSTQHTPASASTLPAVQNDGPITPVEVGDLLIAAHTPASMQEFTGKRVELNGQFFPGSSGNSFELVRLLILCCAADAQPLAVRVDASTKPNFSDMAWAKVVGTVSFVKKGGVDIPVVTAENLESIPQPADPYVYHGGSRPASAITTCTTVRPQVKFQLPPR